LAIDLIVSGGIAIQNFWEYLKETDHETFDTAIALAPQQLVLQQLWDLSQSWLSPGGQMVVVAQDTDILSVPRETAIGLAMEGTMSWYRLICKA